jgi:hypothetical protein
MRAVLIAAVCLLAFSAPGHAKEVLCIGQLTLPVDGDWNRYAILEGGIMDDDGVVPCIVPRNTKAYTQLKDYCEQSTCAFLGRTERKNGRGYYIDKIIRRFTNRDLI